MTTPDEHRAPRPDDAPGTPPDRPAGTTGTTSTTGGTTDPVRPTDPAGPTGAAPGSATATPAAPDEEARKWAMIAHLSALVGLLGNGIGFLLGPLIVWAIKKDEDPFVDEQGKEAINFQLSVIIVGVVAFALVFTIIGILVAVPVMILLGIAMVVFPIVAAIRANAGEHYRYPFSWRLIK